MDLQAHKRTLSIIHICLGVLDILIFSIIGGFAYAFFPFIENAIMEEGGDAIWVVPMIGGILKAIFFIVFVFTALPSIIGGIALLQGRKWGMMLLMIAGCLSLFSFPVGTAVGIYTIYVFIEDNKQKSQE